MIIRTQSRESIVEVVHIYISEMVGDRDFYIFGTCASNGGVFSGSKITLGLYKSKEKALEELDRIDEFFSSNPNGLYKMS